MFLRDLPEGPTRLVSANAAGTDSSGGGRAYLTPNGRFVAFERSAGNQDVFLRDVDAGVTRPVNVPLSPSFGQDVSELFLAADFSSGFQVASDDGRFVVFGSSSLNLVSGVTYPCAFKPCYQVYLRDLQAGTTRILSATPAGDMAGDQGDVGEAASAQISGDGRVAVFQSPSSNLSRQPDANNTNDVFSVGTPQPVAIAAIPTLGGAGLALLAMMMAALGLWSLRR